MEVLTKRKYENARYPFNSAHFGVWAFEFRAKARGRKHNCQSKLARLLDQFTTAINKKDRAALIKMMPKDFSDGGGGLTADEWLQFIDENERKGAWRDLQNSFARGTVVDKKWSKKGKQTRVTRDNAYYFEFRKDKKWYFAGVVGD